jgi:hypothetical protein
MLVDVGHEAIIPRQPATAREAKFVTTAPLRSRLRKGLLISRHLLSRARKQAVPVTNFG